MAAALLALDGSLRRKVLAGSVAAVVILLVGFSRIYLGVHWFTDVVAGTALGGLWLCVLWAIAILAGEPRAGGAEDTRRGVPGRVQPTRSKRAA